MRLPLLVITIGTVFGLAATPEALADRININLTSSTATSTGPDGNGALGGGTWNRIRITEAAAAHVLVNSTGNPTAATAQKIGTEDPGGLSQTGNTIQAESWGRFTAVTLKISGLIPNQIYKVAVYGDRNGSGPPGPDSYIVNGLEKTLPNPGAILIPLPGVENIDFAEFVVNATAAGEIMVSAPIVAAIQIEGVIGAAEAGPQIDCRISKSGASSGGKGDNLYRIRSNRAQSITQKTTGKRAARYFVNIENDGDEIDRCFAMGFWGKRKAKVKVLDRGGSGNVTAAVKRKNHRYDLSEGETRRFKVVVKPAKRKRATIKVRLCGSPSTLVRSKQDCSTCVLKVK